jgi:hypothetical protein
MADRPETRLDRIARDLSRTLLHGSRVTDNSGHIRPATIATAQQIRVDLPASGPMNFEFLAGGAATPVLISRPDAINSQSFMTDALGKDRAKYLTLAADDTLPTWVFGQRSYTIANPVPKEDKIDITVPDPAAPGATRKLVIAKLPASALAEVSPTTDNYVTLTRFDSTSNSMVALPRSGWQPAIKLRFKLKAAPPAPDLPAGTQIFELEGTLQGDRYFLDRLGLLDAFLSATSDPNPPDIEAVALALQETSAGTPTQIDDWTIIRTNLTREARSGETALTVAAAAGLAALPFVAISGGDADQDKDAVRLLQMISITNSGGYFLRTATAPAKADTLVLSIVIKARSDPDTDNEESTWLPRAANAVALAGATMPDSIRFNGLEHIQIAPAVPPGHVLFGWTRTEPDTKTTDEDKFGYGTISLVDYSAIDGAGQQVGLDTADTVVAISPSQPLRGKSFERMSPLAASGVIGAHHLHTGDVAAIRLGGRAPATTALATAAAAAAAGTLVQHFRATLQCFDEKTQSPYWRIADGARGQIAFTPGFRDVFGNRFDAASGPVVRRRLFYTDPLTNPAEWPGIRFAAYPGKQSGKPYLYLEMQYRYLKKGEDKKPRLQRLQEIRAQLLGANADVATTFSADPIVSGTVNLSTAKLADQIGQWIDLETANTARIDDPLVAALAPIACNGQVNGLVKFEPALTIARTNASYGPADGDLPHNAVLAAKIKAQIGSTSSRVWLQAASANATSPPDLVALAAAPRPNDEFREIAKAFQEKLAAAMKVQVGFLRNRLNEHELWLVPNGFFPTAPSAASYAGWFFATARPLSNKLGTESFTVPDFSATCTTSGPDCWRKHPIVPQTVIDQDLDELGRVAFRLVGQESTALAVMTDRGNATAARQLLSERERIALTLTSFQGDGGPGYLVPLYAKPDGLEQAGVVRACKDAFLGNLNAFYDTDTVVQLPLAAAGSDKILIFEGKVTATFTAGSTAPRPLVSNVLIGGGDGKVTVLYDLPPGTRHFDAVQRLEVIAALIHHVQLPLKEGAPADKNLFNQGPWLELVVPQQLAWKGPPADFIPVADRRFPAKPVIKATETLLPWLNTKTPPINASNASLLVRWGWRFIFGLIDASSNDVVHVTVRYNEPPAGSGTMSALTADEWRPQSLLNSLFALKMLQDNLRNVSEPERLQITADLATFLRQTLAGGAAMTALAVASRPEDHFAIKWQQTTPAADTGGRAIMKGPISVAWSAAANTQTVTVSALADATNNNAVLTGSAPVRNYRTALRLLRNETFGPVTDQGDHAANPSLIYECAPVESPVECWASNVWPPTLTFDLTGHSLQQGLRDFFAGLLLGTDLSSINLEVGAALRWQSGKLEGTTPFSILPTDIKPTGVNAADAVADFVYGKYTALLSGSIPPDVTPKLRLRVKLASPDTGAARRTLLDINAIDFPL